MQPLALTLRLFLALVAASLVVALLPALPAQAGGPVKVVAREVATSVERQRLVELPIFASHVALHWRGQEEAELTVAFSVDGREFGAPLAVEHDEAGGHSTNGRTYGGVLWTGGARFARVVADRPIGQLSVVAMDSRAPAAGASLLPASVTRAAVAAPTISSRADWKADESLRFDVEGNEIWPAEFHPLQKLIVHHTAGANNDPNPEATVRAIYHYQAITRGWGDIGYNYLIDEAGRIYEGRYSGSYDASGTPIAEDAEGRSVVGAHVRDYNTGTLGVALLGTLTKRDATPAARAALERLLAWKAERHGIDPLGSGLYSNPVNGYQKIAPNITGHRDWAATLCPGDQFYATLPALRKAVAARIAGATVPAAPSLTATKAPYRPGVRLNWTAPDDGGSPITEYRILRWKPKLERFVRIATVSGSTLTYRDATTRSGRTYRYVARAVNAIGKGARSNEASAVAR